MTSETPQKGDCSRRSDENESDEIRLHARPARVTASRDHRGVLGGPICNRKHADLGPLEHLGLTLAAYAASGTARALARAKLGRAGIVRARLGLRTRSSPQRGTTPGEGVRRSIGTSPSRRKAQLPAPTLPDSSKRGGSHRFQFVSTVPATPLLMRVDGGDLQLAESVEPGSPRDSGPSLARFKRFKSHRDSMR
jgi:hypothetical protein